MAGISSRLPKLKKKKTTQNLSLLFPERIFHPILSLDSKGKKITGEFEPISYPWKKGGKELAPLATTSQFDTGL